VSELVALEALHPWASTASMSKDLARAAVRLDAHSQMFKVPDLPTVVSRIPVREYLLAAGMPHTSFEAPREQLALSLVLFMGSRGAAVGPTGWALEAFISPRWAGLGGRLLVMGLI
jgi:hypothetical protein